MVIFGLWGTSVLRVLGGSFGDVRLESAIVGATLTAFWTSLAATKRLECSSFLGNKISLSQN